MLSSDLNSGDILLQQLRNNEMSFYDIFLDIRRDLSKKKLAIALKVIKEYFTEEDRESISFKVVTVKANDPSNNYPVLEFDSKGAKNEYLSWILSRFFNRATDKGLAEVFLEYLKDKDGWKELSDKSLDTLLEKIKGMTTDHNELVANTAIQQQVLIANNFAGDALRVFKPELPQDFSVDIGNGRDLYKSYTKDAQFFDYVPSYQLHVEEVKYVALAKIAMDMHEPATSPSVASSCRIEDVDLRCGKSQKQTDHYFAFAHNKQRALEVLNVAKFDGKPAFLTSSSGGHWATLALRVVDNELYIFKFDSLNGTMVDQLAKELVELAIAVGGFKEVHPMHNLSEYVQYSQNCGIASAGFIAEFSRFISQGKTIDEIKSEFGQEYKDNIINPDDKHNSTEKFISEVFNHIYTSPQVSSQSESTEEEAPFVGINSNLSESLSSSQSGDFFYHIHYDASRLKFGFLDLDMQRYKLYYDIYGILSPKPTPKALELSFWYVCSTIFTLPAIILQTLINSICEASFIIQCIFSTRSIQKVATEYGIQLSVYETYYNAKKNGEEVSPTPRVHIEKETIEKFYSQDLVKLVEPEPRSRN